MSAIWIVLLDVSGSMGDGFTKKPTPTNPLTEVGRWKTKLEAAKDLLVSQVHATRGQDIAVIAFSTHARCEFKGSLADFTKWEKKLEDIQPEDQTNLADALSLITRDKDFEKYKAIAVLVLSDGLSNVGDPKQAAEDLINKYPYGRIDTILIDETPEGRVIAEQVSINGWVKPAESILQLEQAVVSGHVASLRQSIASLAYQRYDMEYSLADAMNTSPPSLLVMSSPANFVLTPESLSTRLAPALAGMESIEKVSSDINETSYNGRITSISQSSPVSISVSGWEKVFDLFKLIFSWGREHARIMSHLEEEKLRAEIDKLHAETAQGFAQSKQMSAEADRIDLENHMRIQEANQKEQEIRKMEQKILQSKINLANQLLEIIGDEREFNQTDGLAYAQRLTEAVDLIIDSGLEFRVHREPDHHPDEA